MVAKHFAQRGMEQMRGGVVQGDVAAALGVDASAHGVALAEYAGNDPPVVQVLVASLGGVFHLESRAGGGAHRPAVADLSAGFGVEGSRIEHDDAGVAFVEALHRLAAASVQPLDVRVVSGLDVARERHRGIHTHALFQVGVEAGAGAAAFALFGHGAIEAFQIDAQALLAGHVGGHVRRESVGVVELEDGLAGNGDGARRQVADGLVQERQAGLQRLGETPLFVGKHAFDASRAGIEFRVGVAHDFDDGLHQAVEERPAQAQLVAVPEAAANDAAEHVAAIFVAGQNAVGH